MNNQQTISCIEIGPGVSYDAQFSSLIKKTDFTTNINYIGHTASGIPVYRNNSLKEGEIKQIMKNNQDFVTLEPGKYNAKCVQVFTKHPNEDLTKEIKVVELEVEGQEKKQYVTYFLKGYSEKQMEISQDNISTVLSNFGILVIEELAGKEVNLVVKKNNKGFINYFIYAPQKRMNWDGAYELPCTIFSYSKKVDTNHTILGVKFRFNGEEYTDFIWYNLNNEWSNKDFEKLCSKANLNPNAIPPKLQINATLKVSKTESKKEPGVWYTNKKLILK